MENAPRYSLRFSLTTVVNMALGLFASFSRLVGEQLSTNVKCMCVLFITYNRARQLSLVPTYVLGVPWVLPRSAQAIILNVNSEEAWFLQD